MKKHQRAKGYDTPTTRQTAYCQREGIRSHRQRYEIQLLGRSAIWGFIMWWRILSNTYRRMLLPGAADFISCLHLSKNWTNYLSDSGFEFLFLPHHNTHHSSWLPIRLNHSGHRKILHHGVILYSTCVNLRHINDSGKSLNSTGRIATL